jgi:DNA polymerase-3 subunit delta'
MSMVDLIGNTRIKVTLASYLRNQRIPSSMIFTGGDAYHQLQFALTFAKSMDCLEKKNDACDRCRHCLAIAKNIFPDVQVLSPEGQV